MSVSCSTAPAKTLSRSSAGPGLAKKLAGHKAGSTTLEDFYLAGVNAYNMAASLMGEGEGDPAMKEQIYDQAFMETWARSTVSVMLKTERAA